MSASTKAKPKPSFLCPQRLYTLPGFYAVTGWTYQRERELKLEHGLQLPRLRCGKRVFIDGAAAIEYIRKAAQL